MSDDRRHKDADWKIRNNEGSDSCSVEFAQLAVLMDLRDELKRLNTLLHCSNFVGIPGVLRRISKNTAKPRPKRTALRSSKAKKRVNT